MWHISLERRQLVCRLLFRCVGWCRTPYFEWHAVTHLFPFCSTSQMDVTASLDCCAHIRGLDLLQVTWLKSCTDYLSPSSSVLCCRLHLHPAVPEETCCPHFFLQMFFPGVLWSPSISMALSTVVPLWQARCYFLSLWTDKCNVKHVPYFPSVPPWWKKNMKIKYNGTIF